MSPVTVTTYLGLLDAIATRRRELGLTLEALDDVAGFTVNYAAKLACGMRNFGPMSLAAALGSLHLELALEPIDADVDAALRAGVPRLPPEVYITERQQL